MLLNKCMDLVELKWRIFSAKSSDWSTPARSSSWSLGNRGSLPAPLLSCASAPHHVCSTAHMIQFPVKASFSAEKGAVIRWKSWNQDCWVTLPQPTSSPWPGKFVSLPCALFFLPLLSLALSLGHSPKKSNTDINTGLVKLLFPQCTQYIYIPTSFIGRAGWSQAPTDPNSDSHCRICSLCSVRGPSTVTTVGSAEEETKQLPFADLWMCKQSKIVPIAQPRLLAVPWKCDSGISTETDAATVTAKQPCLQSEGKCTAALY